MNNLNDREIIRCWRKNAKPWVKAIAEGQIRSRIRTTNQAIINAVTSIPGDTVIDIGCGEGWLARELLALGVSVSGLDVVPELIQRASQHKLDNVYTMAYEDISEQAIPEKFDIAVCNFSLLGKQSTEHVIRTLPCLLNSNGHLIIQTLHPIATCDNQPYINGWREGSWAGCSHEFSEPAPWYFRTVESWFALLKDSAYQLVDYKEPTDLQTGEIASLIMVAKKNV